MWQLIRLSGLKVPAIGGTSSPLMGNQRCHTHVAGSSRFHSRLHVDCISNRSGASYVENLNTTVGFPAEQCIICLFRSYVSKSLAT